MDIVMVHGIWDTGAIYRRMAGYLGHEGHRCLCPDMNPANGAHGLKDLAMQLRDTIDAEFGTDSPLAMVGFSMGAIITRHYLQALGGAVRTSHFFSISGPHKGTLTAHLYPGKAARDMRFGSALLNELNRNIATLEGIEAHSYRTPFDLLIVPSVSSRVDWASNHTIPAMFHHRMIVQKRIFEHIAEVLEK